jgi:hypothetical protein
MATTYEAIATVTVGSGGAASIDFTSIPATYTDLLLKVSTRNSHSVTSRNFQVRFNSSTSNYSERLLYGDGSTTGSVSGNNAGFDFYYSPAANSTANTFGNVEIYIPNYASSNYKSASGDGVTENNATEASAFFNAGLWSNTAAITSITLRADGFNFVQYSTATLYGIKNS